MMMMMMMAIKFVTYLYAGSTLTAINKPDTNKATTKSTPKQERRETNYSSFH
jgi:hypothetical protein